MNEKIEILGVNIDKVTMEQAFTRAKEYMKSTGLNIIYTPNSEIIMHAKNNKKFKETLNNADMLIADGIGVVIASKILGNPLNERVAGYDLLTKIINHRYEKNLNVFLFGGKPEVVEEAGKKIRSLNNTINICGYNSGYFNIAHEDEIIDKINDSNPDVLFVALGAPRQEEWIDRNKHKINSKLCMGVGGSFDILAGVSKRAPKLFIKFGLEWLYRLIKEPWRFVRMLNLPKFIINVVVYSLKKYI